MLKPALPLTMSPSIGLWLVKIQQARVEWSPQGNETPPSGLFSFREITTGDRITSRISLSIGTPIALGYISIPMINMI